VLIPLALTLVLYLAGVRRMRRRAGPDRFRGSVGWFLGGWVVLAVALASPLHPLGGALFSAHMLQHELVMAVAAPLLILGRPLAPLMFSLPAAWRRPAGRWTAGPAVRGLTSMLAHPLVATLLHAGAVLIWHVPALYERTLTSEALHAAQHASFLVTALMFWWALLRGGARPRRGAAVIALFVTTVYTGGLGALLTVSDTAWYTAYGNAAAAWGLTPLEDQQLAGIIMWMPGAGPYLLAALLLMAGWLRDAGVRTARRSVISAMLVIGIVSLQGCTDEATERAARLTGGSPERGRAIIPDYGGGVSERDARDIAAYIYTLPPP